MSRLGGDLIVELITLRELLPRRADRQAVAVVLTLCGQPEAAAFLMEGNPTVPKFTDALSREWSLRITVALIRPLREAGLDLNPAAGKGDDGLDGLQDPERLGRVMWLLCEPQAAAAGVTPEQFAEGFDGPTLFAAFDALVGAIADFTHRPVVAAKVKEMLPAEIEKQERKQIERLTAKPATPSETPSPPSPATPDPAATPTSTPTSNAGAGSSPASPASTPAP